MHDTTERVGLFWQYVSERRALELARRQRTPSPWTGDRILRNYRFTNTYRASDRVSQYLIRHVQYAPDASAEPAEVAFRTILFRVFNLPATYEFICTFYGGHPTLKRFEGYPLARYMSEVDTKRKLWNNAYMMTGRKGEPKHATFLGILERMMRDQAFGTIVSYDNPASVYSLLHEYPLISDFLAMQYTTDLGYAAFATWNEDDFIVPGHGARRGAYKLVGESASAEALIRFLTAQQDSALGGNRTRFRPLGGTRPLSLMDIQNCLCEFDKYTRVARPEWKTPYDRSANPLPKQKYRAWNAKPLPAPFFSPKWGIPKGGY